MTRPRGELTTYRARGIHATNWANLTRWEILLMMTGGFYAQFIHNDQSDYGIVLHKDEHTNLFILSRLHGAKIIWIAIWITTQEM